MAARTLAPAIRDMVSASRDRFWRPGDFDGPPAAVAKALSRLADAGVLHRVRRGLYWRGTPTMLGMSPPPSDRLAAEVAGRSGIGPAGLSAALELGLATQVPRHDTLAIPGRVPRNPGPVRFVSRAASTGRLTERLSPAEVALLEVLRDWPGLVELAAPDAADRIAALVTTGAIRPGKLARAAPTEPPRVRDRLRQLLTDIGRPDAASAVPPSRGSRATQNLPATG